MWRLWGVLPLFLHQCNETQLERLDRTYIIYSKASGVLWVVILAQARSTSSLYLELEINLLKQLTTRSKRALVFSFAEASLCWPFVACAQLNPMARSNPSFGRSVNLVKRLTSKAVGTPPTAAGI